MLPIFDVTPFTLQDFPGRTACIVWFSGCNMRCGYCHNPQLVKGKGRHSVAQVMGFLEKRRGFLDGVVLSGGEASLYRDIVVFAAGLKALAYAVKLDTNGTRPDILRALLDQNLLDYVALDYKAPAGKYKDVTATALFKSFEQSLSCLCGQDRVDFEVRTTVHGDWLDEEDVAAIAGDLAARGYRGTYYIQNYVAAAGGTLGNLPPPRRRLDIDRIEVPPGLNLGLRNF